MLGCLQKKHNTHGEIQKAAILAESRHAKLKKTQVNAVEYLEYEEEDEASAIATVVLDTELFLVIAALHAAKGRPVPSYYKRKPSFASKRKNGGPGSSSDRRKDVIDCWYCGKKGHIIKNGNLQLVEDFWTLNSHSHIDKYPMTDVRECIGDIGRAGSTVFSTLDLTAGFWQQVLHPNSHQNTAFTVPGKGQFQWVTINGFLRSSWEFSETHGNCGQGY